MWRLLRVSTYEIVLPLIKSCGEKIKDYALIVNGIYGAFDVVPKEAADKIVAGDADSLPPALGERLRRRGHITDRDEKAELDDALLIARISAKLITESRIVLFIMPTYDCNFRCPYCFERRRLNHGKEWLERVMDPAMIEAVFKAAEREQKRGRWIESCTLFGGEPFLGKNFAAVRDICEGARKLGIPLNAITNGYEIDRFLDLIVEYKFNNLKISVDGTGEAHDRRRRHKDGLATYGRIMENIASALSAGVNVTIRININRENVGEIARLTREMAEQGFTENVAHNDRAIAGGRGQFSYSFKAVEESETSPNFMTDRDVLDAIALADPRKDELAALNHESMYVGAALGISRAMTKNQLPYLSPGHCNAVKGKSIIDPFGNIFPCAYLADMADEMIGLVDKEDGRFAYGFRKAKWDARTGDLMTPCRSCPYIFFCGGGCAAKAKAVSGDPFRHHCGGIREKWNFAASRVAAAKWAERGEEELTLSYAGPLSRLTAPERQTLQSTRSRKEIFDILNGRGFFAKPGTEG